MQTTCTWESLQEVLRGKWMKTDNARGRGNNRDQI